MRAVRWCGQLMPKQEVVKRRDSVAIKAEEAHFWKLSSYVTLHWATKLIKSCEVMPDIYGCADIVLLLTVHPINNSNDRKIKVIHSERERKKIHPQGEIRVRKRNLVWIPCMKEHSTSDYQNPTRWGKELNKVNCKKQTMDEARTLWRKTHINEKQLSTKGYYIMHYEHLYTALWCLRKEL